MFGGIYNVLIYIDDILIFAKNKIEHDKIMNQVMSTVSAANVKFNVNKLQYCVLVVQYLGHTFSEMGMVLNDDRIAAIQCLQNPSTKVELQTFLGIINYVMQFVPNLSELTAPLHELLKKEVSFIWSAIHSQAVSKIKEVLVSPPD